MDSKKKYSAEIDRKQCIECGLCAELNEDIFIIKNHKSCLVEDADLNNSEIRTKIVEMSKMCPVGAIKTKF